MIDLPIYYIIIYFIFFPTALAFYQAPTKYGEDSCKCFPGDKCWPTYEVWDAFNASIGGKLISTIPIAAPCHDNTITGYDIEKCRKLRDEWFLPETHLRSPSSIMAPYFTNNSCNPFLDPTTPCGLGNYAVFAVNATNATDYQKTLDFCSVHNIRLVIRNTGHDYNGKSTGAGSLALWTNHLKIKEVLQYNSVQYSGAAVRFGAGILVYEAIEFADAHDLLVVAGNENTVGLTGGYIQGGGHGPLASKFGLAADQVLEWEVVIPSGEIVTASPDSADYSDLHWALAGGGGGTFGIVLSVTVKAYPPLAVSTASLTFSEPTNASEATTNMFFDVVGFFTRYVPIINDVGGVAIWFITAQSFTLPTIYAPGMNKIDLDRLLQPILDKLNDSRLEYTYSSQQYNSFLEGYLSQPQVNVSQLNIGGRLIPRFIVEQKNKELTTAIRNITTGGGLFSGVSFNVSNHHPDSIGANPYLRDAVLEAVIATPIDYQNWDVTLRNIDIITYSLLPQLTRLTPNGGAYLNEADFQQSDWQANFYGTHYPALRIIKSKYDPEGLLYALGAVGSERWTEKVDGRLCKT